MINGLGSNLNNFDQNIKIETSVKEAPSAEVKDQVQLGSEKPGYFKSIGRSMAIGGFVGFSKVGTAVDKAISSVIMPNGGDGLDNPGRHIFSGLVAALAGGVVGAPIGAGVGLVMGIVGKPLSDELINS